MKKICLFAALLFAACATQVDRDLEKAKFLLEKVQYSAAQTILEDVVAKDPNNLEAQYYLAVARIGHSVLGDGNGYVGKLADIVAEQQPGESAFYTFSRIAPQTGADLADLRDARDGLITLAANPDIGTDSFFRRIYFQLYLARLFEIASIVTEVGATSPDLECNANPALNFTDGIPDDFDPNFAFDQARFQDNIDNIETDGSNAGFPTDFPLNSRIQDVGTDFLAAVDAADFLVTTFGDPTNVALCIIPK